RAVAVLMLEGHLRPVTEPAASLRTPAPEHARKMLDRLIGVAEPYERVEEFQADLLASRERPTQTTRSQRGTHLVLQMMFLALGLIFMDGIYVAFLSPEEYGPGEKALARVASGVVWPVLAVVWAFLFRGGWALRLLDVVLVDTAGRRANRLRCAWRA